MLDFLFSFFSHDIGIDLGTANTLVLVRGKGIVIREPSVVARQKKTKQILAIGTEAKRMLGKTPEQIEAIRPLQDGVIADFDATAAMLKYYVQKVHSAPSVWPKIPRPRIVVGIPSGVTEVERRAVQEAALSAGARQAFLIEEPMAAAIGAGLPILEPSGSLIIDIGGGTTEMAIISLGGIVLNKSLRLAGDEMDAAIVGYARSRYGILIGERTAEEVKIAIGRAGAAPVPSPESPSEMVVRGRDLETGLPRSLKLNSGEIAEALSAIINEIITAVSDLIEETPPELVSDILEKGIVMAGGGSLLRGIDKAIAERAKIPVWLAEDPMTCVVRGCGRVLEDEELLQKVRVTGGLR